MVQFSIATPVLNALPALRRCVGSVRGQGDVSREHLVQDGGSLDGTAEWLRGQPDVKGESAPDAGMYDAVNRAWSRAGGEFLAWLNADEQYLPGTLQAVADAFRKQPEIDVVFGDVIIVDEAGQPLAARREIPLRAAYVRNGFLYALSCSLFFRRSLLDRGWLRFDTGFRLAGDMELVLRLMASGVRVRHLGRYLALFGVSGRNLSAGHSGAWARELDEVRRRSGAWRWPPMRRLVLLGRHAERWARGCYARADLSYDVALDETPVFRRVNARGVTPFFAYETAVDRKAGEGL